MALPSQFLNNIQTDPEFLELEEDVMRLIKEWLFSLPAISDKSHFVNGYKMNEASNLRFGARHEAGHIMMLWFSNSKVDVSYATIIHPRERGRIPCTSERFQYKGMKTFLSDYKNIQSYFFESICFYMGGIRCEQRYYGKEKMHQCQRDVHFLCIKAFRLAHMTLEGFPRIKNIKSVALMYIKASLDIANELLMEKKDLFMTFEYELYKKRFMNRTDIVKVLGRRPKHGVNLYDKFLRELLPKLYPVCVAPIVLSYPQQDAVQESAIVDSSPKIYTQL